MNVNFGALIHFDLRKWPLEKRQNRSNLKNTVSEKMKSKQINKQELFSRPRGLPKSRKTRRRQVFHIGFGNVVPIHIGDFDNHKKEQLSKQQIRNHKHTQMNCKLNANKHDLALDRWIWLCIALSLRQGPNGVWDPKACTRKDIVSRLRIYGIRKLVKISRN